MNIKKSIDTITHQNQDVNYPNDFHISLPTTNSAPHNVLQNTKKSFVVLCILHPQKVAIEQGFAAKHILRKS